MTIRSTRRRTLGRVVLFLVGCALVLVLTSALPVARPGPGQELVIGSVASLGAFALTALFVRWDGVRLDDVGARPRLTSLGRLAVGIGVGLSLVAAHSCLVSVAGHVRWVRTSGVRIDQVGLLLAGYLVLSAREELAFHGYPLRRLEHPFGVWAAQGMIAAVFALEHVAGGWSYAQALWGAATGSLLFGTASVATRGLAVPVGVHAAWNVGDWMRGNRAEPGVWRPEIDPGFEGPSTRVGIGCYVAVMALATIGFWYWHRVNKAATVRNR